MSVPASWITTPFSEQRKQLLTDESLQGPAFCRAYAGLVDRWLVELLGDEAGVALVAIGGYGREELAPAGDLDVLLVHRDRSDVAKVAERVWYPIWEEGIALDHSVNTLDDALKVADRDLEAALGFLDARTVAGEADLGYELRRRARDDWRLHRERRLRELDEGTAERHRRWGDVAFLLEPDLKRGRGGLRDVHAMRALSVAVEDLPPPDDAVAGAATLLSARVALHRQTRRASDQLILQEQEGVADALGLDGADALMQQVSAAARTISWAGDDAWHRVRSNITGTSDRAARADRVLSDGVVERASEVMISSDASLDDPSLPLRLATASATSGLSIARSSLEQLRDRVPGPGDPWPDGLRDALLQLLATGSHAIPAFEALDQYGLITRLLPEWEPVRCRRQHNPYHRFTVDRHLLEATALAAELAPRVRRPDLLLVAAWLHDLGKGYPGDHTVVGVELMTRIASRLGFSAPDAKVLVRLVRDHLLLADAATRRDIQDPATLMLVAEAVGDRQTLELLAALTEADSKATGDSAWSDWKAGLIAELVDGVGRVLAGQQPHHREDELDPELVALVESAAGAVTVQGRDDGWVVILAPDRPGLFCQLSGLFAIQGLDVLAAELRSTPGRAGEPDIAVDVFRVEPERGDEYDWERFEANLTKVLDGRLALEPRIAQRAQAYKTTRPRRPGEPLVPEVTVHNDASEGASVIEIRTGNAIGVLYRLARAFLDLQLDVRHAKVQTLGDEVVDTFYVVDGHGEKVVGEERLAELRRAVLFELGRVDA
ncbi:MAG TPA: [protein-PII] uridylyltransferase [Acidimicrobiia bacterium]|nr:[protein-PII] uridylyltransferase [Acidimicrobiia bacterium]